MNGRRKTFLLFAAAFFLFAGSRWTGLRSDFPLNVDESLMISAINTARFAGHLPWRDFDTTTVGPVPVWFLCGISSAFAPLSYAGIHGIAAILWAAAGVLVMASALLAGGSGAARISFIVLLGTSLISQTPPYLHFSSELLPSVLLAGAGLSVICMARGRGAGKPALAFAAGVLCSLAALSKLQVLPVSLFLGGAACVFSVLNGKRRAAGGVAAAAGAAIPVVVIASWLVFEGQSLLAFQSYVLAVAHYGSNQSPDLVWLKKLAGDSWGKWRVPRTLYAPLAVSAVAAFSTGVRSWRGGGRAGAGIAAGWSLAALAAAAMPAFRFEHHGILLLAPLTLLVSILAGEAEAAGKNAPTPGARRFPPGVFPAAFFAAWIAGAIPTIPVNFSEREWEGMREFPSPELSAVCKIINENSGSGDPVAVWGWAPEIFAVSGRPSATRHIIGHFLIDANPVQKTHRANYISDLERVRPRVFVDALAPPFFLWHWAWGYGARRADSFPELAEFLNRNYYRLPPGKGTGETAVYVIRSSP